MEVVVLIAVQRDALDVKSTVQADVQAVQVAVAEVVKLPAHKHVVAVHRDVQVAVQQIVKTHVILFGVEQAVILLVQNSVKAVEAPVQQTVKIAIMAQEALLVAFVVIIVNPIVQEIVAMIVVLFVAHNVLIYVVAHVQLDVALLAQAFNYTARLTIVVRGVSMDATLVKMAKAILMVAVDVYVIIAAAVAVEAHVLIDVARVVEVGVVIHVNKVVMLDVVQTAADAVVNAQEIVQMDVRDAHLIVKLGVKRDAQKHAQVVIQDVTPYVKTSVAQIVLFLVIPHASNNVKLFAQMDAIQLVM